MNQFRLEPENGLEYVIDSSSLINLDRYYLPFDEMNILRDRIKELFTQKTLILLDKVKDEVKYSQRPLDSLLKGITNPFKVPTPPTGEDLKMIDRWCVLTEKTKKLNTKEQKTQKDLYLNSADPHLVIYALNGKKKSIKVTVVVVTEENTKIRDSSLFNKIPAICKQEELVCINLPTLLKELGITIMYDTHTS